MNSVTIHCEDTIMANSLAIWFESGEALGSFSRSDAGKVMESCWEQDRQDIPGNYYAEVTFDKRDDDRYLGYLKHEVEVVEEF